MSKEEVIKSYIEPKGCISCTYAKMSALSMSIMCDLGKIYVFPTGSCDCWKMRKPEPILEEEEAPKTKKTNINLN